MAYNLPSCTLDKKSQKWLSSLSKTGLKLVQQVLRCVQEARKTSPVQQGRQYRAHAKSSSSESSQSPPRHRAR